MGHLIFFILKASDAVWFNNLFKIGNLNIAIAFSSKNIPACETRIVREKTGMPWNKRIAIHPLENGNVELTPVESRKEQLKLQ